MKLAAKISLLTVLLASIALGQTAPKVTVSALTHNSATLSWNSQGSSVKYDITVSSGYSDKGSNKESVTLTDLTPSKTYSYTITATKSGRDSSTTGSFTTLAAPPPPKPSAPTVTVTQTYNSATFTFGTVAGGSFDVKVATNNGMSDNVVTGSSTGAPVTISGLSENTRYYYAVTVTVSGQTSDPTSSSFTTPSQPPPSAPGVTVVPTFNSATFSFGAVTGGTFTLQVASDERMKNSVGGGTSTGSPITVTSLQAKTTYYYSATVTVGTKTSVATTGSFTTADAPLKPPTAPTPLAASSVTAATATLNWTSVTDATGYDWELYTGDFLVRLSFGSSTTTSANVTGLSAATRYRWRVRAKNSAGSSDWVNAEFTTPLPPPATPQNLSANSTTVGANLSWGPVSAAAKYFVQVATDQNLTNIVLTDSSTTSSKTVGGLSGGTKYWWHVQASNAGGLSGWTISSFTTLSLSVPSALGSVPTATSVTLAWGVVSEASSYVVEVHDKANYNSLVKSLTATTNSASVGDLTSGQRYYWQVQAVNAGGKSGWAQSDFTTLVALPDPPTNLKVAGVTTTAATLSWDGGGSGVKFELKVTPGNLDDASASSPYALSQLTPGTTYTWQVRATKSGNSSAWVNGPSFKTDTVSTPPPGGLNPPTNLEVTDVGSTTATLKWEGSGSGVKFEIAVSPGNINDNNASSPYSLSKLTPGTTYSWQVRATKGTSTSSWATGQTFKTLDSTVSKVPTLVAPPNESQSASTNPTLVWHGVAGASGYQIDVSTKDNFSGGQTQRYSSSDTTLKLSGLSAKATYFWRVAAGTSTSQNQNWSDVWKFLTSDSTVSGAPVLVSPSNGSENISLAPTLVWKGVSGTTGYQIEVSTRDNFSGGQTQSYTSADTTLKLSGLKVKTTYYWHVAAGTAITSHQNWSDAWDFTTADTSKIPATPSVTCDPRANSAMFTFDAVSGATSYDVKVLDKQNNGTVVGSASTSDASKAVVVSGLDTKTKYFYQATVTVAAMTSLPATGSFTTLDASTLPSAPNVSLSAAANSVTFTFAVVAGASSYDVRVLDKQNNGNVVASASTSDPAKPVGVSGLQSKTKYYYDATVTISGQTSNSAQGSFTTLDGASLPESPNLSLVTTTSSVTFTFTAVTGATSYDVRVLDKQTNGRALGNGSVNDHTRPVVVPNLQPKTKYYYEATVTVGGLTSSPATGSFTTDDGATAVEKYESGIPKETRLTQNYPNPFNPTTAINYQLSAMSFVKLSVFDITGREVETLVEGDRQPGVYTVVWNALRYPSGVYFYRLQTSKFVDTKRLVLLK